MISAEAGIGRKSRHSDEIRQACGGVSWVKPKDWNGARGEVRKSHRSDKLREMINDLIEKHLTEAKAAILELKLSDEAVTPSAVKRAIKPIQESESDLREVQTGCVQSECLHEQALERDRGGHRCQAATLIPHVAALVCERGADGWVVSPEDSGGAGA